METENLAQADNAQAHPREASGAAICCPAVDPPGASTLELDEDVPCPNCQAELIRQSTLAGPAWACGACGKFFLPGELINAWPERGGVLL